MNSTNEIRFGVNYVPSRNWYYFWEDGKDLDGVEDDFSRISSAGLDHIRLQLRWDIFQTEKGFHAPAWEKLRRVLETAQKFKLDVELAVFTGWLSGFWFLPDFANGKHIITDCKILKKQKELLAALNELKDLPALKAIDLGNEINMFSWRENGGFTAEEGDAWAEDLFSFIQKNLPHLESTVGVDHLPWFFNRNFSRKALANAGTASSLHTWTKFTQAMEYGGVLGAESLQLARYCAEMAAAYAHDINRPVHIQEFGISKLWEQSSGEIEPFVFATVKNAVACENVTKFTYWCSHDIDERFKGFDPLEYDLGLFDTRQNIKRQGKAFINAMNAFRRSDRKKLNKTAIIVDDGIDTGDKNFGWYYGEKFCALILQGAAPAFVLRENADDRAYLESRNIKETAERGKI